MEDKIRDIIEESEFRIKTVLEIVDRVLDIANENNLNTIERKVLALLLSDYFSAETILNIFDVKYKR